MRLGNVRAGGVAVVALALSACGGRAPEDVGAAMERHMESAVAYFNDIADALATVTDQASANSMAQRFQDEFNPRMLSLVDNVRRMQEVYPEEELEASAEEVARALGDRMERASDRYARQIDRLDTQPQLWTAALEEAVLEWGQLAQSLEMEASRGGGGAPASPGSPEWCRQMMQKPEAEWTMEESFAFANRCIGG